METHDRSFAWKEPPYEYEFEKLPIDLILGDESIRKQVEGETNLMKLQEKWDGEIREFLDLRQPYLLYT